MFLKKCLVRFENDVKTLKRIVWTNIKPTATHLSINKCMTDFKGVQNWKNQVITRNVLGIIASLKFLSLNSDFKYLLSTISGKMKIQYNLCIIVLDMVINN